MTHDSQFTPLVLHTALLSLHIVVATHFFSFSGNISFHYCIREIMLKISTQGDMIITFSIAILFLAFHSAQHTAPTETKASYSLHSTFPHLVSQKILRRVGIPIPPKSFFDRCPHKHTTSTSKHNMVKILILPTQLTFTIPLPFSPFQLIRRL
jgi:hypothetical protein